MANLNAYKADGRTSSPEPKVPGLAPNTQAPPDHDTGMIKGFELQIDFFLPVWRRVVLLAVCFGWAAVEFLSGAPFWGIIFSALGGYALWQLFLSGWPGNSAEQ